MPTRSRRRAILLLLAACAWGCNSFRPSGRAYSRADQLRREGNLTGALREAERGYTAWGGRPEAPWHWKFRLLTADILLSQNNWQRAKPLLETPPASVQDAPLMARLYAARGRCFYEQNDQPQALENMNRALDLASRQDARELIPEIRLRRATVMVRLGDNDSAVSDIRAALSSARANLDRYMETNALAQMGFLLIQSFRYDEAIDWLERALRISRQAGYTMVTSLIVDNLGRCYYRVGNLDKAGEYFREAEKRLEQALDGANQQIALANLGSLRYALGDYHGALGYYQQALVLAEGLQDRFHEAKWLDSVAATYLEMGDARGGEPYVERSISLKAGSMDANERALSYETAGNIALRKGDLERAGSLYEEALRGEPTDPDVVWELHAGLGYWHAKAGRPARAWAEFQKAAQIIDESWSRLLNDRSKLTFPGRAQQFYRRVVDFLMSQNRSDDALSFVESSRARLLSESVQEGAAPPRELARQRNSALISYWLSPGHSYAWITGATRSQPVTLPPQEQICALVQRHQTAILENRESPTAEELYSALVAPVESLIPRSRRVILVPDGCLHELNFETLRTPSNRYWIEDTTLEIAASLRLLGVESKKPVASDSILLVGDPVPTDPSLAALPYASQELGGIAAEYPGALLVTRERATPEAYAASDPSRFSLIHFAAHAVPNRDSPLDSAIVLSPGRDAAKLYMRDVRRVKLSASLVTVSACQSAGSKSYAGEGLVGFAWAFLGAGARNVIASLWDVSDRSTAAFMQRLYARIQAKQDPAEALRAVKLEFLHSQTADRKPYYWAPFQIYVR
jgi:CHAT domain-containing protein/Tfp pilus assembly protein PilF